LSAKQNHCNQPGKIYTCPPHSPAEEAISAAVTAVRSGKVICFPTGSLYGLGADAWNPGAVKRVFEIKKRPVNRPILVLIDSLERLDQLVSRVPPVARDLIDRFWPGKLTLVFQARPTVPELLTAGTGKIGVRLPAHPVPRALVSALKGPLTGTSANISGQPGCHRCKDIPDSIRFSVSMLLDSGALSGGAGSTIVDISRNRPIVLREGSVASAEILQH